MNKHIELVKRWLADPKSVTVEELNVNADAAWATANAAQDAAQNAWAVEDAADAAAKSAAADAAFWVRRYEKLTDE